MSTSLDWEGKDR